MDRRDAMVGSAAAIGLGALALSGCGGAGAAAAPPRTSAQERLDLAVVAVVARIGDADVRSSGIVVDGDAGLVLTAAHTVWGARSLKLATQLGILHGRIVARAPCDDLALVEVQPRIPGLLTLPPAPAAEPARGQLLRSVGRRRADPDAGAFGFLSIPVRATGPAAATVVDALLPPQAAAIQLDADLVPEASGGPVLDQGGRLVGMGLARDRGPGVTVPWSRIRALLDRLTPGPRQMYVGWRDQYRCVGRQHAYARAMHPGFRPADARLNVPIGATRLPGTEALDG